MNGWGGAQWVLSTLFVLITVVPPIVRLGLVEAKASWRKFWVRWTVDVIERCGLIAILWWGGFWNG